MAPVDSAEVWHWYGGSPLVLDTSDGEVAKSHILGSNLSAGERPQFVVAPNEWQRARSSGAWTLVGCTVAPGFLFSKFEIGDETFAPAAAGIPSRERENEAPLRSRRGDPVIIHDY